MFPDKGSTEELKEKLVSWFMVVRMVLWLNGVGMVRVR